MLWKVHASDLNSQTRVNFTSAETTAIHDYLMTDPNFRQWVEIRNYEMVESDLKNLPLQRLRSLVGANGLENAVNNNGHSILNIIDPKIRTKVYRVWSDMTEEERRGVASQDYMEGLPHHDSAPPRPPPPPR